MLSLQNIYAPDDDPNMEIVDYERTFDQNEELGLNDMKTENYAGEAPSEIPQVSSGGDS
jgi:zinc finger protein